MADTLDRNWGAQASAFYDQSDDEGSSSDEFQQRDEAALLQKVQKERLDKDDFAMFGDSDDDETKENIPEPSADKDRPASASSETKVEEVTIKRDVSALTKAEQTLFLRKEHPELLPLLSDLEAEADILRQLNPLEPRLHFLTKEGRKWVQLQLNLRREYILHICFYLRLLANGRFYKDHPIVTQLLKTRTTLRKYAELDTATKTEIEQASRLALKEEKAREKMDEETTTDFSDDDLPIGMDPTLGLPARLLLSEKVHVIQAKREELTSHPSSASFAIPRVSNLRLGASGLQDMFRLPTKKTQENKNRIEDPNLLPFRPNKKQTSEILSEAQRLEESKGRKRQSGDVDVSFRERKKARKAACEDEPSQPSAPSEPCGSEKKLKLSKKERKELKRKEKELENLPKPPDEVDGKRQASNHILNNRGLVRSRKKTSGNARVSNRQKYEKAIKRRKGAVVDVREGASDGATYAGEETGVRTTLKKSKNLS